MNEKRFMKAVFIESAAIAATMIAALRFTSATAIVIYVAVSLFAIVVSWVVIDPVNSELYRTAWWFHMGGCAMIIIALVATDYSLEIDDRIKLTIVAPFFLSALLYIYAKRKEKKKNNS